MKTKLGDRQQIPPLRGVRAHGSTVKVDRAVRPCLKLDRVMVPIDFTRCSTKALQYAVSLAQDYHANIVLFHVVENKRATERLLQDRKMELATLASHEVRGQVPVTILVRVGEPVREIVEFARAGVADLLLISTHARAGLPDFFLGSEAEQIVRYAPCPVLVVREQEHDFLRRCRPDSRTSSVSRPANAPGSRENPADSSESPGRSRPDDRRTCPSVRTRRQPNSGRRRIG